MICRCKNCGGSIEWKIGDAAGVCRDCGAVQEIDKSDIYETAGRLSGENTEVPVSFEDAGGTVFLVAERPLGPLAVRVKAVPGAFEVAVTTPDSGLMVPIEVTPECSTRLVSE